jgi:hypothetical protein
MPLYSSPESTQVTQVAPVHEMNLDSVSLTSTAVKILEADATRKGFSIFNAGSSPITLGLVSDFVVGDKSFVEISPKAFYEWGFNSGFCGELWARADGDTVAKVFSFS